MPPRREKQQETQTTPPAAIAAAEEVFAEDPACEKPLPEVLGGGRCALRRYHDGMCSRAAPAVQQELGGPIPTAPDKKRKEVKMELACALTIDDLLRLAQDFARLHADLGAHDTHASMVKADLKAKETRLTDAIAQVAEKIRTKKELREVVVAQVQDFLANAYYEVREDTFEEIPGSRRPLSAKERQAELGLPVEDKRKNSVELVEAAKRSEEAPPSNAGKASRPFTADDAMDEVDGE